jgi:hypothetical protein
MTDRPPTGVSLSVTEREQLRDLVVRHGEARVARRLELSRFSVNRAIAGLAVRRATATVIRTALREGEH